MTNQREFNEQQHQQFVQENGLVAKTILNGKEVTHQEAVDSVAAAEQSNQQTGIQPQHSNNTEAVQSGKTAKKSAAKVQTNTLNVKSGSLQSGETHLEQHVNQAQTTQQTDAANRNAKANKTQGQE
jgi:hypothetical protein